ncbi:MAG: TIGR00730 family Rossman fold protein [bacterium]|nr:TIGR00730 family Rossman fold protein [bacterium]
MAKKNTSSKSKLVDTDSNVVTHPTHPKYQLSATTGAAVNYRDSWRVFKIVSEFVDGYNFLNDLKREVTILGSARLPADNKYYQIALKLGQLLGQAGFTTITGGGPGIMEAANKGAFEVGGESVGLNIQLPFEQRINPYVKKATAFFYFFTRKVMLTSPANAFIFFPGGFGTMDEFFEVVDSMELGHMPVSPIVLVGKSFWEPLLKFLRKQSSAQVHSIDEKMIDSWQVVETAEEAFDFIKDNKDRDNECLTSDDPYCQGGADWRVFRIMAELVEGFEFLTKLKNNVSIFGTKSILPGSSYYEAAYQVGKILAKNKLTTITGGGPGIMEAANKGAFEMGGESVGISMRFNRGVRVNNYVTKNISFFFPFVRKLIITSPADACVFFPGGFGSLHQLFELLTLIETKKIKPMPILLYGKEFWQPLVNYIHEQLLTEFKTISVMDEEFFCVINRPEDVLEHLK